MCNVPMQRLTLEAAAARLRGGVDTLIIFHRHPDGDAVGSGFALKLILEAMGCRALCICEDEIPERLRFLVDGLQGSILERNLPVDLAPAQILAVDTASPAQMGTLYETYAGRIDLMIDHHGKGEMYADGYILPACSSSGELVHDLARELIRTGRLAALPDAAARLLYAALSSDTGCFRFSNATPSAHRTAAALLEHGFDVADINHRLFAVKSEKLLLAEKLGFDRLHRFAGGRIGIVDMPASVKTAHGLSDEHLDTLVDVARSLAGVEVAVAIRQPDEGPTYRVSMRSSCAVDVSAICAAFGGGGHVKAAGCTIVCDGGMDAVICMVSEAIEAAF